ncbi:MAG: MFS transporter [Bacillus subtilis]|nr:MFS transporter [Bacillus subtilis]
MKLNFKKVFFVGMAFFLISLFWQTYDSIITKILIDKFGLNQTWSGVVMAFDNVLALFLLPLFGGLSDKTNSKYGRRTPYVVVGTVIAAFAFVLLSFTDNVQTVKIETETAVIADYEAAIAEKDIMLGAVASGEVSKKAKELADGKITQAEYDVWLDEFDGYVEKWYDHIWVMFEENEL